MELDRLLQKSLELTTTYACLRLDGIEKTSRYKDQMNAAIALRARLSRQLRCMISITGIDLKIPPYSRRLYNADIVQDLNDLATACEISRDALAGAGFDFSIAHEARRLSRTLSDTITALEVFRFVKLDTTMYQRNDILQKLEDHINTICRIGRTAFSSQPAYCKQYFRLR